MLLNKSLLAGFLALRSLSRASQIFSNTGTTSGWDAIFTEASGTVQQVTNVVAEGSTALKMTQVYTGYGGRYHSEVHKYNVYKKGDTGFYGFNFRLQDSWQFSPAQSYNIAQFIADFTDLGCSETYMPSTMIWLEGNQLNTRVKTGSVCPKSSQVTTTFPNIATVSAGAWHKIVLQVSWKSDGTGFFKLWFDGTKVVEQYNINTNVDDGRYFQFRVGLYANGWYDDGGMVGTQGTRQVWYDEIAAGTTFADADSAQW